MLTPNRFKVTVLAVVVAAAVLTGIFLLINEPQNGRNFAVHIVDTIVIQADPPAKKLLKYMEKKYNKEFERIDAKKCCHHDFNSVTWAYWYNGITVTTVDDYSKYYHIRDNYGTYLDNYGCYLINDEVESELNNILLSVIKEDFKVSCFPEDLQEEELPANMTVDDYLNRSSFRLCIAICGKGENAEQDLQKILEAVNIKSKEWRMVMLYLDEEEYSSINMESYRTILDMENCNLRLIEKY